MPSKLSAWRMVEPAAPLELQTLPIPEAGADEVLVEVMACGLCHTDVSFLYGGVRPRSTLPLTLGHEILGRVVEQQAGGELDGRTVLIPAVIPCGRCDLCAKGRGNICRHQSMPGNDIDGGFASHFLAPRHALVPVPDSLADRLELAVVADAVSTAYQAVLRCELEAGGLLIVVGSGGVGSFAAQIAKMLGAHVVAIDLSWERLTAIEDWADLLLDASELGRRDIKDAIVVYERQHGIPRHGRRILECSGSAGGQQTAFSLLSFDAVLGVIGFTMDKLEVRLSNLMAFDARVFGNWGCLPEHYPALLDLIASGKILLEPFVETHPMSDINHLLLKESSRRPVLTPDF